nr:hypothetical protein [Candidatus Sigynarchaeum springense]
MFLRLPDPARDSRIGLPRRFALWYGPIIDILQKLSIETRIATPLPHHPSCPGRRPSSPVVGRRPADRSPGRSISFRKDITKDRRHINCTRFRTICT